MAELIRWQSFTPKDAAEQKLDLTKRLDITAPLNENGERCPWPWEPQQLVGAPLGQYRCTYCYAMCVAGMEHHDYAGDTFADGGPGREHVDLCGRGSADPCFEGDFTDACSCWRHGREQDRRDSGSSSGGTA